MHYLDSARTRMLKY